MINNCSYKSINPITSDTPTPLSVYQGLHKHLDFPDNTTLNNITEYECVFRSKTKIYRTGYTYDGSTFTTGNLATKLTVRHVTDNVLPEHWAQPDIDNNTVIVCVTHNVRYQKDCNYDKSKTGTIIQSKCEGHSIPLSLYSSEEIAANSTLLCTQTSINELSTKMQYEFSLLYKQQFITPKEINYLISSLNNLIKTRNNSNKYLNVYNNEYGSKILQSMSNIEEEQISSVKPSDSVIIRQINELNNYIGKLQVDKSYHNMTECDQYPNNKLTTDNKEDKLIQTSIINKFGEKLIQDMQDCICYSDCNGYSVCWCYGNCNYY